MLDACVSRSFTDIARPLASNPLASLSELELASYSLLSEISFSFIDFGLRTLRGEDWSVSAFGRESMIPRQLEEEILLSLWTLVLYIIAPLI